MHPRVQLLASAAVAGVLLASSLAPAAAERGSQPAPVRFQKADFVPVSSEGTAIDFDPATGRLAVGDRDGVWLHEPGRGSLRVLRRGPVADLRLTSLGLWIATEEGLFFRDAAGRVEDRSPRPGEGARSVRRLAGRPGSWVCASATGIHHSVDGRSWTRLATASARGEIQALDLWGGSTPSEGELWWIAGGRVWKGRLAQGDAGRAVLSDVARQSLVEAAGDAVDLRVDAEEGEVLVLSHRTLSVRRGAGWRTRRLSLPPGAEPRRIARAAGRLWIATDRGLIEEGRGGWQRAAAPVGSAAVAAVAGDVDRVFAVGRRGLWFGRKLAVVDPPRRAHAGLVVAPRGSSADRAPAPSPSAEGASAASRDRAPAPPLERASAPSDDGTSAAPRDRALGGSAQRSATGLGEPDLDPDVRAVQRAALRYLALGPETGAALRRGVRRRGWLPELQLRSAYGGGRGRSHEWDETFTGGEARRFFDRERDRERDFAVSVALTWDLGDIAYSSEFVDVSKELRELLELRDDVLDEVNQLYFERRRVLLDLAAAAGRDPREAARLRLRSAELAAGLDAWTGGWWSRQAAPALPLPPRVPEQETRP